MEVHERITGSDPTPRQFVKDMLPSHYEVKEMLTGSISCKSLEGIECVEDWDNFMKALRKYFGNAFREVHHWTCTNHVYFTVYYSYNKLYNLIDKEDGGHALQSIENHSQNKEQ